MKTIGEETIIVLNLLFMDEGLIELVGTVILICALVRCAKFTVESKIRLGGHFWMAGVLTVLVILRRELSFLMDFEHTTIFGYAYDAVEDSILLGMYVCLLGELIYARKYVVNVLKSVRKEVYLGFIILFEWQYIGEHSDLYWIPHSVGFFVEELSESMVYIIGLAQLWTFHLSSFEYELVNYRQTHYHYLKHAYDRKKTI